MGNPLFEDNLPFLIHDFDFSLRRLHCLQKDCTSVIIKGILSEIDNVSGSVCQRPISHFRLPDFEKG